MLYFTIAFVIVLLGLYAFYEMRVIRSPSTQDLPSLCEKIRKLIAIGECDAAGKELAPLLQGRKPDPTLLLLQCLVLRETGQLAAALKMVESSIKQHPKQLALQQEKGRILLQLNKPEEALEFLKLYGTAARSEEDLINLATASLLTGQIDEAWSHLKEHTLDSGSGRLLALAGDCHFYLKNHSLAIQFYQQAQHFGWVNHRTLSRTGHCLREEGNLSEAERYFRAILTEDPSDITATLGLGSCFESKGLFNRALLIYQSGQGWDDRNLILLRQAGACAFHLQEYSHASLYLSEAIAGGFGTPQSLAFLGFALEQEERWSEAEQAYILLTQEFPNHPAGYRGLAWLYGVGHSILMDDKSGLQMARKALELLPNASSWELLSACEARSGNFTRAHDIYEQLSSQSSDKGTRLRRRHAMRSLRKRIPLNERQVCRILVA